MFHIIFIENINIITTPPAHHIWTPERVIFRCAWRCSLFLLHSILVLLLYSPHFVHRVHIYELSYVYYTKVVNRMVCLLVRWYKRASDSVYLNFVEWESYQIIKKKSFFKLESNKSSFNVYWCVCATRIRIRELKTFALALQNRRGNIV